MKILIEESVLRQALGVLEDIKRLPYDQHWKTETASDFAITALRTALDAAEKVEPVAEMTRGTPCHEQ